MQLNRNFWIRLKQFLAIFLVLHCWEVFGSSSPKVLTPLEACKSVKKLPAEVGFDYSGIAFYSNRLYATCNIGLLEIENGSVTKAYQWNKNDSDVEGPWTDSANGNLWVWRACDGCLGIFDSKTWQSATMPWPTNRTVVRRDFGLGFQGFSSSNCFWFEFAGNAWPWDARLQKWKEQIDLPAVNAATSYSHFERLFILGDKSFIVVGYEPDWKIDRREHDNLLISDTVQCFEQSWLQVTNATSKPFFVTQTVSINGKHFLRTYDGEILQVDPSNVSKLETPGFCEALAVTSAGNLLASFHNLGVYEFKKDWKLRFKAPYSLNDGEHWVHLAENDGQIALAVSPVPQLVANKNHSDYKTVFNSSAALWIFDGQELEKISFPKN